ncbi:hypothetical protein EJ02DRAFT_163914 [Clathrospora elynae]|uniref:Uncharacterized protein n=1 Tax=Clathrospora elynae TaxID=706981 RepID=A0A6A5SPX5_9PLEO|nr:hypothetical protein EJ02DRAFT_163914 [Clathrospora elynae]
MLDSHHYRYLTRILAIRLHIQAHANRTLSCICSAILQARGSLPQRFSNRILTSRCPRQYLIASRYRSLLTGLKSRQKVPRCSCTTVLLSSLADRMPCRVTTRRARIARTVRQDDCSAASACSQQIPSVTAKKPGICIVITARRMSSGRRSRKQKNESRPVTQKPGT